MTIDEAISHAREKAEMKYEMANSYHTDENVYMKEEMKCRQCAEEHEQLAEWLEELKEARKGFNENRKAGYKHGYSDGYNKAIDEFAEQIKELFKYESAWYKTMYHQRLVIDIGKIDEIAEQMKGE